MIQEKDAMLTIKSNFNNFRDRQGQLYIAEDLDKLCKALVTSDVVNFPVKKEMSAGYTKAIAQKIAERLVIVKDGKYLVINDISLQVVNALTDLGVKPENIYLAYGKWKKNAEPDTDPTLYLLMQQYIKANIVETFNIIKLEDIFTVDIKFNGVIANPPYGKIGAQITEKVVDNVDFDKFQLLLPLKDIASGGLELCSHIDMDNTLVCPPHSFGDADILTHIMNITKVKNKTYTSFNDLVADSFIVDKPMIKFMKANALATHYAIDTIKGYTTDCEVKQTFVFHTLRIISQHTAGMDVLTEETVANSYNLNNIIKPEIIKKSGGSGYKAICFGTEVEKQNFVTFYKANRNFINRMIANQFIGVRDYGVCFPKVDWTQPDWTIEKILKSVANYTDEEIAEVLATMEVDYTIKDDASIERLFGKYLNKEN
jgi:hypothetical protein